MRSQSWRPLVYLGVTAGAVVVVLGLIAGFLFLVAPSGMRRIGRVEGRAMVLAAGVIAYLTVMITNRVLKKYFGRQFGTYLDDPDTTEDGPQPAATKQCLRCGLVFGAFHNDFHAAGFCSHACHEAYLLHQGARRSVIGSRPSRPGQDPPS